MPKYRTVLFVVLMVLAGCGDDNANQSASPSALAVRIVEAVDASAGCETGEQLLSAYCFADPGRSISASGPALVAGSDGRIEATCLTGGRNLRLFCMKP